MDEAGQRKAIRSLEVFSDVTGSIALICGALEIASWLLGSRGLAASILGPLTQGPEAAAGLLVVGATLIVTGRDFPGARGAAQLLSLVTMAFGIALSVRWIERIDVGLDRWVSSRAVATDFISARMALPTALVVALLGLALLLKGRSLSRTGDSLGSMAFLFLYFGFLYQLFKIEFVRVEPPFEQVPQAWLLWMLLSLGVTAVRPSPWLVDTALGRTLTGLVGRRFLASVLVTPALLGLLWIAAVRTNGVTPIERLMTVALGFTALIVGGIALDARRLEQLETERERSEEALAMSQAELKKAAELAQLKDSFLSTVSHEMRTPLSLIMGYAELLEDTYPDAELIAGIQDGTRRLAEHVERIVEYSALLGGTLPLYRTPVDMAELARDIAEVERARFQDKNLTLSVEVSAAAPIVLGDSRRLSEVIKELLDNAIKVTPPGRQAGLRVGPEGDKLRVDVWDSGPGIGECEIGRLWEAFGHLEAGDAARRGGLGLGLPITKKLVELHGGTVTVASKPGGGSTFTVLLPAFDTRTAAAGPQLPDSPT